MAAETTGDIDVQWICRIADGAVDAVGEGDRGAAVAVGDSVDRRKILQAVAAVVGIACIIRSGTVGIAGGRNIDADTVSAKAVASNFGACAHADQYASGSAIGREGAMILLAALAASFFAQRFTPKNEWKLWIACGAAAGMASARLMVAIARLVANAVARNGMGVFGWAAN